MNDDLKDTQKPTDAQLQMYDEYMRNGLPSGVHDPIETKAILHSVAVCLRYARKSKSACAHCPWKSGGRPCVFPRSVCSLRWRKEG